MCRLCKSKDNELIWWGIKSISWKRETSFSKKDEETGLDVNGKISFKDTAAIFLTYDPDDKRVEIGIMADEDSNDILTQKKTLKFKFCPFCGEKL